jgi:photosystem II stability/assembly factor-like uncharacterized protein
MRGFRLFAATGDGVGRLDVGDGEGIETRLSLVGSGAQCVAVDPHDPDRVYVGTFDDGVYRTLDGGDSWERVGEGIAEGRVLSVAFSPVERVNGRSVVYVGTEPSNVYRSEDDGRRWRGSPGLGALPSAASWSFPPRPWTHHVRWIAPHQTEPGTLFVGIELGGVMRSRDGGETWEDRNPGAYRDAHALATHPAAPGRVYEAAGEGVALSDDGGASWRPVDAGMDRHYAWGLAVDAAEPDLWYVSASHGARQAHRLGGGAEGVIFRKRGDAPWEARGGDEGGLARPSPVMPYALVAPRDCPNWLIVGMHDGELLLTEDAGETWRRQATGLPRLLALGEA